MGMESRKGLFAVIDVGSHETTMKIARLKRGSIPIILDEVSRTVPVGIEPYTTGRIDAFALAQVIDVLNDFKIKMNEYGVVNYRAVATSAFREATNGLFAVEQIFARTGIRVEILSGSMDNHYLQIAISEGLPGFSGMAQEGCLVLIIGAGSIQLTLYHDGQYVNSQLFQLGALRIRELLGNLERVSSDFNALLAEYISGDLNYYRAFNARQSDYRNLIVIGGPLRYLKYVAKWDRPNGTTISTQEFLEMMRRLKTRERRTLTHLAHIPSEHESLIVPAGLVVEEVLAFTGVEKFHMPSLELIEGILFDELHAMYKTKFVRDPYLNMEEAANHLARRYRTDKRHVRHVQKLAVRLFDLTEKIHRLGAKERRYLALAAIMHNIGRYISMTNDEIHTFEVVNSSEIIGLNDREKEMVALIACFHNGHLDDREVMLTKFTEPERLTILKLISILCVANSLDAGHKQKLEIVSARIKDSKLQISVTATQDATIEIWNFEKHIGLFSDLFGYKPTIIVRRIL